MQYEFSDVSEQTLLVLCSYNGLQNFLDFSHLFVVFNFTFFPSAFLGKYMCNLSTKYILSLSSYYPCLLFIL